MIAATIGSTEPFSLSSREPVIGRGFTFNGIHADYDVLRDGTILAFRTDEAEAQVVTVYNWRAELRARMRVTGR